MDANEWIARFAEAVGAEAPGEADVERILELAAVAAHSSERIAAPVACWIAASAGLDPAAAHRLAERIASGE